MSKRKNKAGESFVFGDRYCPPSRGAGLNACRGIMRALLWGCLIWLAGAVLIVLSVCALCALMGG